MVDERKQKVLHLITFVIKKEFKNREYKCTCGNFNHNRLNDLTSHIFDKHLSSYFVYIILSKSCDEILNLNN